MAGHIATAGSHEWLTDQPTVDLVREVFRGDPELDPASNPHSLMPAAVRCMLPEMDGLDRPWLEHGVSTVFCNPPYGTCYLHRVTRSVISAKAYQDTLKRIRNGSHEDPTLTISAYEAQYRKDSIELWLYRGAEMALNQFAEAAVIFFIPAAVGRRKGWGDCIWPLVARAEAAVCFVAGRSQFIDASKGTTRFSAPMDTALVIMSRDPDRVDRFSQVFNKVGPVCRSITSSLGEPRISPPKGWEDHLNGPINGLLGH